MRRDSPRFRPPAASTTSISALLNIFSHSNLSHPDKGAGGRCRSCNICTATHHHQGLDLLIGRVFTPSREVTHRLLSNSPSVCLRVHTHHPQSNDRRIHTVTITSQFINASTPVTISSLNINARPAPSTGISIFLNYERYRL